MAKSQDAKKTAKKEPLKTAKEKKEEKRVKKKHSKTRLINQKSTNSIRAFFYLSTKSFINKIFFPYFKTISKDFNPLLTKLT